MPVQDNAPHLLKDLAVEAIHRELRPVYRPSEQRTSAVNPRRVVWDFIARSGVENLEQAVILRLLTARGELAALGHPQYGSRVHELIGLGNNAAHRNLLKLYILEALQFEPRVTKVTELKVAPSPGTRSTVDVQLKVQPAGAVDVVQIGPFSIELGS